MFETELFIKEKLAPLYKAHYALWVHWWPLWRGLYSGRSIERKWQQYDLVKKGQTFLDYGCGTGSFAISAAWIVGDSGKVYALDCFPHQLEKVAEESGRKGLSNIETILSDCGTGLTDESIDVVWVCDVLHEIKERREVLKELHRVLRSEGVLVIYDGMREEVLNYTTGLFSLAGRDGKLLRFTKTR